MMWTELGTAFALLIIFEGIMPFINPSRFRQTLQAMAELNDKTLRIVGFVSMLFGLLLLYLVH
ncbi:hypothetical protein BegalDRAFT_0858 [Beggiatoa alba B18LD]|uniref:DUF2065 domain-containing protein n=1 Tax=Beggiatoa alba B18LD TaxID=395493 RepID=I3CDS3_9GAMM|nr:DUF2065 domain-containing protein [Beggiatoa alba]EIJ41766.1 hypothetical protein BegalDRAFT_0858 [Beggiatoa alba B18LD]